MPSWTLEFPLIEFHRFDPVLDVFKLVSLANFGTKNNIQGPERFAVAFFVVFVHEHCQFDPF